MKNILISLMMFVVSAGACANELEIISLRHRSAEELIPIIRPLLSQDEMVSGMNYQLILRASPRNIAQIKRLLEGIDTQARRLKITVMQDVDSETLARLTEVSGSVGRNARVILPGGTGQDNLNVKIISTRSLEDDKKVQQLQVTEGNRALVRTGQTVPVPQRQVVNWGRQVIETTQYRDVSSGFYVLPRIHGDNVTLEVSTQNDTLAPDQPSEIRVQNAASTVSGRLGEWIVIGGIDQLRRTDNSTITSSSTSSRNEQRNVLIKVEEVN